MSLSKLKSIFKDYKATSHDYEKDSLLNLIIDEIFKMGFDYKALDYFSKQYDKKQKESLISNILNELPSAKKTRKYKIKNVLSTFLVETNKVIRDQILPAYVKILAKEKRDFKLVFSTLEIFTSRWNEFEDEFKKTMFEEFLKILDNPSDFFIEEGVYEITDIILSSTSSLDYAKALFSEQDMRDYLKRLLKISQQSKKEALYAVLESIRQILSEHPSLISKKVYEALFPLFNTLLKRFALFYPAKRRYIKISFSYLTLILMFESDFYSKEFERNIRDLISRMVSKIDHADVKHLLELLLRILEKSENLSRIQVIRPAFKIIRSLLQKKNRLDEFTRGMIYQIMDEIWDLMSDEEKDLFYQETDYNNSVL